jgi:hypothetical protein
MRVTRTLIYWGTALLAALGAAAVDHAQSGGPIVVTGAWPLGDFARRLEGQYAKPVTFETPLLLWRGHMRSHGLLPNGTEALTFVTHSFVLPENAGIFDAPALSVDLLSKVVKAYHQSNPGFPRYRVSQSQMGFHIIPTEARDESGALGPVQSVLDATVEVPVEKRTASEHAQALLDAVTRATGIATVVENPIDSLYAANGYLVRGDPAERSYMLFEWGASGMSAREALIDLLKNSATTTSWTLACIPDFQHGNRQHCMIGFHALAVNGRVVFYDRCTKCRAVPTQGR